MIKNRVLECKKKYAFNYRGALLINKLGPDYYIKDMCMNERMAYFAVRKNPGHGYDGQGMILCASLESLKNGDDNYEVVSDSCQTFFWFPITTDGYTVWMVESTRDNKTIINYSQVGSREKKEWDVHFRGSAFNATRVRVCKDVLVVWDSLMNVVRVYNKNNHELLRELRGNEWNMEFPFGVEAISGGLLLVSYVNDHNHVLGPLSKMHEYSKRNWLLWNYADDSVVEIHTERAMHGTSICRDSRNAIWVCDRVENVLSKCTCCRNRLAEVFKVDISDLLKQYVPDNMLWRSCKISVVNSSLYLLSRTDSVKRIFCFDIA